MLSLRCLSFASKWLGIQIAVEFTILPRTPLPQIGRFDLVTAYRCQFNRNRDAKRLWNLNEWAFFLDDLRDHVLKPKGRFVINLSEQGRKGRQGLRRDDPELRRFLAERGAREFKKADMLMFDPLT